MASEQCTSFKTSVIAGGYKLKQRDSKFFSKKLGTSRKH